MKLSELSPHTAAVIRQLVHELHRHPVKPAKRSISIKLGRNKSEVLINPTLAQTRNWGVSKNDYPSLAQTTLKRNVREAKLSLAKLRSLLEMPGSTNEADIFQRTLTHALHKLGRSIFHGSRQTAQGSRSPKGRVGRTAFTKPLPWGAAAATPTGPKITAPPPKLGGRTAAAQKDKEDSERTLQGLRQRAIGRQFAMDAWRKEWGPEGTRTKENERFGWRQA